MCSYTDIATRKALVGTGTVGTVSCACRPAYTVDALDAGCCGMAGAFGYEKETLRHFAPDGRASPRPGCARRR